MNCKSGLITCILKANKEHFKFTFSHNMPLNEPNNPFLLLKNKYILLLFYKETKNNTLFIS